MRVRALRDWDGAMDYQEEILPREVYIARCRTAREHAARHGIDLVYERPATLPEAVCASARAGFQVYERPDSASSAIPIMVTAVRVSGVRCQVSVRNVHQNLTPEISRGLCHSENGCRASPPT
jgi:hypothetical protein